MAMTSRAMLGGPAIRPGFSAGRPVLAGRTMATTTARLSLKESNSQNPDPEYEKHKQDALRKQKQGKGHWKPELASDSEEAVKADRADAAASEKEALNKLQERTKGHAEDKAKAGTSMHDSL